MDGGQAESANAPAAAPGGGGLRESLSGGFERLRSSVSFVMPTQKSSGLLLPGGARLGGDHIPQIVNQIFPAGQAPLVDFRVDLARHGPRAGKTVDVWVLDGWSAVAALRATGQLEEFGSATPESREDTPSPVRKKRLSLQDDDLEGSNFPDGVFRRASVASVAGSHRTAASVGGAAALQWENFQARTLVLLQLGFLLHLDPFWLRYTRLRILVLVPPAPSIEREWLLKRISEMTRGARISADVVAVDETQATSSGEWDGPDSDGVARATAVNAVVQSNSAGAGMVLLQASAGAAAVDLSADRPDVSVEAGGSAEPAAAAGGEVVGESSLALWQRAENLSRGLPAPVMLVYANDEQVTTDEL